MSTTASDPDDDYQYAIGDGEAPSEATFLAVGEATDRDPLDLPPLGRTLDTDSLDDLVGASPDAEGLSVRFDYAGCAVTVTPSTVTVSVR